MSEMAYYATMDCGCLVAAMVDDPTHKKDTAKEIASWARRGDAVNRGTVEEVRAMRWATGAHARGRADCDGNPTRAALADQLELGTKK